MSYDYNEKRDFMRMALDHPITVKVEGENEGFTGTAKDLSAIGMLIGCDRQVAVGAMVELTLDSQTSLVAPLKATAEVLRATPADTGGYDLGVAFKEFL